MKAKKVAGVLHLWLGLICGVVVFISMFAAAVFAWQEELTDWYFHDMLYVKEVKAKRLPYAQILKAAEAAVPNKKFYGSLIINDASRCYEFSSYLGCDTCAGISQWSATVYWDKVYVDPYTAQVTGKVDMLYDWIELSRRMHQNLLLRYEIGHYIVGFSTLAVILLALTGLILWFPKNKAAFKQRFSIKWEARWRRVNYDIHNVGGFYTWIVILFLAITGLTWTFQWWSDGISRIMGSAPDEVYEKHEPLRVPQPFAAGATDVAIAQFASLRPSWTSAYLSMPQVSNDTTSEFNVYLRFNTHSGWEETDEYHFHPVTGQVHSATLQEKKTVAAKWQGSNYAMHVGSIYGLPSKIIATFGALFLASLPVTGFIIWWGRKNKKGKKGGKEKKVKQKEKA
jgi:uncharacterized iron-regulated membrane protein